MKILVSGAGGFIGSATVAHLEARGQSVVRLVRPEAQANPQAVVWEPTTGRLDPLPADVDAAVHLAGENVFGRWNDRKKTAIYDSRVKGTRLLAERLADMRPRPKVFVCASAIGFYGNCGETILTEASPAGDGFLSRVCRDWEAAAEPARDAGIRVVNLRLGMALGRHGGALAKMLPAYKMGMGGVIGDGKQWISWIALADVVRAIAFALETEALTGPVNIVSPDPATNRTFTKALGHALHRPELAPVPATLLRFLFGDFADETLLASTRAVPQKLIEAGFQFEHPDLQTALEAILQEP